ncbi:hypothetical protein QUF63_13175 [Anaerolineales bacterium HSG25]|nr:hypothetical protein [Anaerolineales bacterium HSG25]
MADISNPYRPNEPIDDISMLFGRQDALDWLERQLNDNSRSIVLSGSALIGKTSLVKIASQRQQQDIFNLIVSLYLPANEERHRGEVQHSVEAVLRLVLEQVSTQLRLLDLIAGHYDNRGQASFVLRELFSEAHQHLGQAKLVLYLDDLHLLLDENMALIASFLTTLNTILDDCPQLHLIFTLNKDQLRQIRHRLIDRAPTHQLNVLPLDASINMVTLPVRDILRFDYGISRRITEITSHHPYYLSMFCHNLLNRQMFDGWVNQRDFDTVLNEILQLPIDPFETIWAESNFGEQSILSGMAEIQGAHGPMTDQEISRYLHKKHSQVLDQGVKNALNSLTERGVLVRMGHISYRFHVELFRFWLRENYNLSEVLHKVNWSNYTTHKPHTPYSLESSQISKHSSSQKTPSPKRWRIPWTIVAGLLVILCAFMSGGVLALRFLDVPVISFLASPSPTATIATLDTNQPSVEDNDQVTPLELEETAEPTPVPSPTSAIPPTPTAVPVKLVTLPSLTFMARDIEQSWRVYTMNADGSDVVALSPEGTDDRAPVWSPGGRQIAYISPRDGNREIYIMNVDGSNPVNVTQNPADDWTPAWSPDGSQLLFSSIRTGRWEIFVMDVACLSEPNSCPERTRALTDDGNNNLSPVWSPNDDLIAFNSQINGDWDIFTMTPNGSNITQITFDEANELAPAWSPDGLSIAFESDANGDVDLFVLPLNQSSPAKNITNYPQANDHGPTWAPDGQQVVFYANREGNWDIYSTTLDGATVVNLTNTASRDEQTPSWRP